jgi:hypothetical protein
VSCLKPLAVVLLLVAGAGCGGKPDLNKDLKPIDPNTPRPVAAGASQSGGQPAAGQQPSDGSTIKPPVSPP